MRIMMLMHVIAHGGCTDTVRESASEADSGRKIPCRTRDSNPLQYCARFFSPTLYQQSYCREPVDCSQSMFQSHCLVLSFCFNITCRGRRFRCTRLSSDGSLGVTTFPHTRDIRAYPHHSLNNPCLSCFAFLQVVFHSVSTVSS